MHAAPLHQLHLPRTRAAVVISPPRRRISGHNQSTLHSVLTLVAPLVLLCVSPQRLGDRVKLIRGVIREVTGYAPYEKRLMEILRGGGNNPTKKAWKFAKNRLGTHIRAKRKVVEMGDVIASAKRAEAAAQAAAKAAAKAEAK